MSLLESIRKWIDGAGPDDPLADVDEQARPRRVWEDFLVRVAREVEAVMQREMFTPPGGPTYIPPEYIVYLSNEDDRDWQGDSAQRHDSFNDWWHERPWRAYPAWVRNNQRCERLWWSGGGWRC